MLAIFGWNFEIWAVQKHENLVDLVKSFPTSIYLLNRRRCSRERASQSLEENSIHFSFASLIGIDIRCSMKLNWKLNDAPSTITTMCRSIDVPRSILCSSIPYMNFRMHISSWIPDSELVHFCAESTDTAIRKGGFYTTYGNSAYA